MKVEINSTTRHALTLLYLRGYNDALEHKDSDSVLAVASFENWLEKMEIDFPREETN